MWTADNCKKYTRQVFFWLTVWGWAPDFDIMWRNLPSIFLVNCLILMSCEHLPPLFSFVGCQNFQRALLSSLNCARRQLKANFKLGPSVMCLCLTFCYFEHTQHTKDTTLYFSTGLMCRHINSSLLLGAIQGSVQLEWPTKRSIATWAAPVGTN